MICIAFPTIILEGMLMRLLKFACVFPALALFYGCKATWQYGPSLAQEVWTAVGR